jgi:hypothetical protein
VRIEVRVQTPHVQPEVGTLRELIGEGATIIGAGSSPADALAIYLKRMEEHGDLSPIPKQGWVRLPKIETYS